MTTAYPIPADALDDRLGFVGTSGSGKTYNAGTAVEKLLHSKARVVILDALDVWWGLRSDADGVKASRFNLPIFGGPHGDLPLNEHAGALIGETVAGMSESCIVSLKGLPSDAAARRFVLAFLKALYAKHRGGLFHLVIDEADLWVPQVVMDRDGDAMKLKGLVSNIVRRGRVEGFIPWLITQRPAVIAKDVLSQVDGLVSFKLTSSQDRDALGGWIDGQADRETGKAILASLPTLPVGTGVVWLPGRGILTTAAFPPKVTFDSSRAPKRGEVVKSATLKPLDLGALKDRLAAVEEEAKANDPKALKAEIARLKAQTGTAPTIDPQAIATAEGRGYSRGKVDGYAEGIQASRQAIQPVVTASDAFSAALADLKAAVKTMDGYEGRKPKGPPASSFVPSTEVAKINTGAPSRPPAAPAQPAPGPPSFSGGADNLTGPQRHLLGALAWWRAMGHPTPSRTQVAAFAGWTPKGSNLRNRLSELSGLGFVAYPGQGLVHLTDEGAMAAPQPDLSRTLLDSIRAILTGPQRVAFEALLTHGAVMTRAELAEVVGWEAGGSNLRNRLSELSTLELVDYPGRGSVQLQAWVTQ